MILLQEEKHQCINIKKNGFNRVEKWFRTILLRVPLLLTLIVVLLAGCGGGGGGDTNSNDTASDTNLAIGVFLDSAVERIHYETDTQSGTTDIDGAFFYIPGESIRFYMGGVMLGEAQASHYMTPVDLVPGAADETHPTVTNICRFLQTLDMDVTMMMDTLGAIEPAFAGRMKVTVEAAQTHMGNTLSGIFDDGGMMNDGNDDGMFGGNTPGDDGMMNGSGMT